MTTLLDRLTAAIGERPVSVERLTGGCIADSYMVSLTTGAVVAKVAESNGTLDIEAYMLELLAKRSRLPVPKVLYSARDLLVIEYMPGSSRFDPPAERHAAELLAELHSVTGPYFGLERDTLIGSLVQKNTPQQSWVPFFRECRLLDMADAAAASGSLPATARRRIGSLAKRLDELIDEPEHPSLLHGDVWTGNVLAHGGRITAFLDPAVSYGHPEIELAFITLFSTFGPAFFDRYTELRPIREGFFETRRHIYNLYPLLVHARLFGATYGSQVESVLSGLGF